MYLKFGQKSFENCFSTPENLSHDFVPHNIIFLLFLLCWSMKNDQNTWYACGLVSRQLARQHLANTFQWFCSILMTNPSKRKIFCCPRSCEIFVRLQSKQTHTVTHMHTRAYAQWMCSVELVSQRKYHSDYSKRVEKSDCSHIDTYKFRKPEV